jgi:hypothetical protein
MAAGSGSAAGSAAAPAGAGVTFEGKTMTFKGGKIDHVNQKERLVLSTGPLSCESDPGPNDTVLEIYMSPGPGGKYYAPGPVGVKALLSMGAGSTDKMYVLGGGELYGVLTLEPGEWKKDNKVKGTIRIDDASEDKKATYTGSSPFEATVCELAADPEGDTPLAEDAGKDPAKGKLGELDFAFKSGIAVLHHDAKRDVDEIEEIQLYKADVDCASYASNKERPVRIVGNAGASGKDVVVGAPQPRDIWWESSNHLQGPAWVKFDAIDIKEGGEIKGSVYGEATPARAKKYPKNGGKLAGTFTAKVCK